MKHYFIVKNGKIEKMSVWQKGICEATYYSVICY
jgi:hypothetical protein